VKKWAKMGFGLMSAQNEFVSEKMGQNGFWFDVLT
jgi:hypothetical protein